jgi:hypothetical protein
MKLAYKSTAKYEISSIPSASDVLFKLITLSCENLYQDKSPSSDYEDTMFNARAKM